MSTRSAVLCDEGYGASDFRELTVFSNGERVHMFNPDQVTGSTLRQQQVLEQLRDGESSWDQLRQETKMNEDSLGLTIWELLTLRRIWTVQRDEVRVYGIEQRKGLAPSFAREGRRATD
ncbi:MAG: hypothetical protein QOJ64_2368 [Acidobacteriota bacterium]|jgi:hypothetical protein|nr:hypothetical protein [Acidobacteriota bacterium]